MSTIDLVLRYAIISIAFQLACAWAHTFQSPWPLADAFQLAPSVERQLFQSLGICFDSLAASLRRRGRLHRVVANVSSVNSAPRNTSSAVYLSWTPRHSFGEGGLFSS